VKNVSNNKIKSLRKIAISVKESSGGKNPSPYVDVVFKNVIIA